MTHHSLLLYLLAGLLHIARRSLPSSPRFPWRPMLIHTISHTPYPQWQDKPADCHTVCKKSKNFLFHFSPDRTYNVTIRICEAATCVEISSNFQSWQSFRVPIHFVSGNQCFWISSSDGHLLLFLNRTGRNGRPKIQCTRIKTRVGSCEWKKNEKHISSLFT